MKDSSMQQTPGIPGTSPVTDNPNPNNTQGSIPTGPGTDVGRPGGTEMGADVSGSNPSENRPATEGGGDVRKYFRCGDVGNADCRWEARGRTEDELRPEIHRHLQEAHGQHWDERMRSHIKDVTRERAA
jgi:predicted small metal-binding protein